MVRPRWHDAVIVLGVVGLLGAGGWALWWDDARAYLWPKATAAPTVSVPTV